MELLLHIFYFGIIEPALHRVSISLYYFISSLYIVCFYRFLFPERISVLVRFYLVNHQLGFCILFMCYRCSMLLFYDK